MACARLVILVETLCLVELAGLEPATSCLQIGTGCRIPSLTWVAVTGISAGVGSCRMLLWSGLVVRVHCALRLRRGHTEPSL